MFYPSRRTVLRGSVGLAAAGALARPHIVNAAAKTIAVWWVQGFVQEEDTAFKALVADYEKQSGDKVESPAPQSAEEVRLRPTVAEPAGSKPKLRPSGRPGRRCN